MDIMAVDRVLLSFQGLLLTIPNVHVVLHAINSIYFFYQYISCLSNTYPLKKILPATLICNI